MLTRMPDSPDTFTAPSERDPGAKGFIDMFLEKEENARQEEAKTGGGKLRLKRIPKQHFPIFLS